jgi:hypothetical protein
MTQKLEDLEDLAAVVLAPTAAFRAVLAKADPSLADELEEAFSQPDSQTVVLIPSPEDDDELEQYLLPFKKALAEKELTHWIDDAKLRPVVSDEAFDEWFEVKFHSIVVSVGEDD